MHIRTRLPDIDMQLGKFDLISEPAPFGGAHFSERFYVYRQHTPTATYLTFEVYLFGRCYWLSIG